MPNTSWLTTGIVFLALSQLIIMLVTVYFHRACSHMSVKLAPSVNKVARFLSWYLIAMVPQEFAAVHRKHHAKCDTKDDPHSPANHGWHGVLFGGLGLYRKEVQNKETIEKYGKGLPVDRWEGFYRKNPNLGIGFFALTLFVFLGWKGLLVWGVLMLWIPFWAAGVINGLGHHIGYRNYQTQDLSTNLSPWGLWVGGEELHNNHHAYPASPKFSKKSWEVDMGWGVIWLLQKCGLAEVRPEKKLGGVVGFLGSPHDQLALFHKSINADLAFELKKMGAKKWEKVSRLLAENKEELTHKKQMLVEKMLASENIQKVWQLEQEFKKFWKERHSFTAEKVKAFQENALSLPWPSVRQYALSLPTP